METCESEDENPGSNGLDFLQSDFVKLVLNFSWLESKTRWNPKIYTFENFMMLIAEKQTGKKLFGEIQQKKENDE